MGYRIARVRHRKPDARTVTLSGGVLEIKIAEYRFDAVELRLCKLVGVDVDGDERVLAPGK
jgi:hypothetical protein